MGINIIIDNDLLGMIDSVHAAGSQLSGRLSARSRARLKIHPSSLSLILSGARPVPDGFAERVQRALDTLATAERATAEARDRVLAGPLEAA